MDLMRNFYTLYGIGSLAAAAVTLASFALDFSDRHFSVDVFYGRLFWGGVWSWFYLLPGIRRLRWTYSGMLLALFPTLTGLYQVLQVGDGWRPWGVMALSNFFWGMLSAAMASRVLKSKQ